MSSNARAVPASSKGLFWTGIVLSALPALALIMSGGMKLTGSDEVAKGFRELGWEPSYALGLGILELACTVIYVIPRTAVLGAILLTGYFGGAVATHVRLGQAVAVAPFILGILVWGGLYLRDARLRALVPLRS
jgi:hypothetical protein